MFKKNWLRLALVHVSISQDPQDFDKRVWILTLFFLAYMSLKM